jgi:hypothetical protein
MSSEKGGGDGPTEPKTTKQFRRKHGRTGSVMNFDPATGNFDTAPSAGSEEQKQKMAALLKEGGGLTASQVLKENRKGDTRAKGGFPATAPSWQRGKDGGKGGPPQ